MGLFNLFKNNEVFVSCIDNNKEHERVMENNDFVIYFMENYLEIVLKEESKINLLNKIIPYENIYDSTWNGVNNIEINYIFENPEKLLTTFKVKFINNSNAEEIYKYLKNKIKENEKRLNNIVCKSKFRDFLLICRTDGIIVSSSFRKEFIFYHDILKVDWNEPGIVKGSLSEGLMHIYRKNRLPDNEFAARFWFQKDWRNECKALYENICKMISKVKNENLEAITENIYDRIAGNINYYGGYFAYSKSESLVEVKIEKDNLKVFKFNEKNEENYIFSIPFTSILSVTMETKQQIESRVTATRLAILGPFALAFKKQESSTSKLLLIDVTDSIQTKQTVIFGGKTISMLYEKLYKAFKIYKENSCLNSEDKNEDFNYIEEIKRLKELLDLDAITQEEYDEKKKHLLNL